MNKNLRRIPFFADLPDDLLAIIERQMKRRRFRKGDVIFREGALGDSMYIIESGQVEVISEGHGDEPDAVFAHLGPGSFFGEMALLLGERRSATVRVVLDAELWELHKSDLDFILKRHPSIALHLSRELSRRLSRTIHQPTVPERINLIAVAGQHPLLFAERLYAATGERILVLDVNGLLPPRASEGREQHITVERVESTHPPDELAALLSRRVEEFGHIVMVISTNETPHARVAVNMAKVVIEIDRRTTPWIRHIKNHDHWPVLPTWRHVDRAARRVARKLVGLVLGAGNARGLAHIGVLEVLLEANVPVDVIAGASMGALIGALYATRESLDDLRAFAAHLPHAVSVRGGLWDVPVLPRYGLVRGERARQYLNKEWFQYKTFEELNVNLRIVATDVATGEEIVFTRGPLADAVRASIGIPGIFEPFSWNERYLIDGAATAPVPTHIIQDEADIIIACNVIPPLRKLTHSRASSAIWRLPGIIGILLRAQEIMAAGIVESRLGKPNVLIQPDLADLGSRDYNEWETFAQRGREATRASLREIKRLLVPVESNNGHAPLLSSTAPVIQGPEV
ncbi:MAG: cyclic nucleotide-binding and patatin-like phospholipase domain-containing protein [Ardenticatenia bacterium]|nr:cyclic nucleotide-binding and patatin-like phospholipase domain-containing protein [Ardenticatenia bacterium]